MQRRTNLVAMLLIAAVLLVIVSAPVAAYYLGRANGSESGHTLAKASQEEAHAALTLAEQATDEASHWKLQAEEASATVAELRIVAEDDAQVIEKLKAELAAKPKPVAKPVAKTSTPAAKTSTTGAEQWRTLVSKYFGANTDAALRVIHGESTGNPIAVNGSCRGLFQIHAVHASKFEEVTGKPYASGVFDPEANIRFAAHMSARGTNWSSWSVKP